MNTNEKAFDALVYLSSIIANSMDMSRLQEMLKRNLDLDLSDIHIDMSELAAHVDVEDVVSHIDLYDLANYHIDMSELASHMEVDPEKVAESIEMDDVAAYLGAEGREKVAAHEQMMEQLAIEHERLTAKLDGATKQIVELQDLTGDLNLALDRIQRRSFTARMKRAWTWIRKTCRP